MNEKVYVKVHYGIRIYPEVCLTLLCLLFGDILWLTQVNKMKTKYMDSEVVWGSSKRNLDLSLEDLSPDSRGITW